MISIDQIRNAYPDIGDGKDVFLLKEYLQYRMLRLIYATQQGRKLVFLGGTCLRLVHDNPRFSEDLDFDNRGLDTAQFKALGEAVVAGLEREGYTVTMDIRSRTAYRCKVRFPGLLFQQGMSGHAEQSVLIQFDTEPQRYAYEPELRTISKFGIAMTVPCCSPSLLLAQKCITILQRPRNKGRDFYDVVFLLSRGIEPAMDYVHERTGVTDRTALAKALLDHCTKLDMKGQAEDV
ncbi:MAG TPA: nucleotidyl transferase AbiEii/AbiGii toxin family protein, partial [Flavobacteriales bacterium]|nr:nucleotidyl transferase AbiEii/AbiGii toxin family protein [Flavobacteriales bacterium]